MQKNVVHSLASAIAAGILFSASAATMAATATATSEITLEFDPTIIIENVEDIVIKNPSNEVASTAADDEFCIAGIGFSKFNITFEGGAADQSFSLKNGVGDTAVPYTVGFVNSTDDPLVVVEPGVAVLDQSRDASSCADGNNAKFQVAVATTAWNKEEVLDFPEFSDTLTITVAAN